MIDLGFGDDDALHLCGLSIAQHDGTLVLADADAVIGRGEKVLVKGETGTGKSTLIRAMAGLWPWGSGRNPASEGCAHRFHATAALLAAGHVAPCAGLSAGRHATRP